MENQKTLGDHLPRKSLVNAFLTSFWQLEQMDQGRKEENINSSLIWNQERVDLLHECAEADGYLK